MIDNYIVLNRRRMSKIWFISYCFVYAFVHNLGVCQSSAIPSYEEITKQDVMDSLTDTESDLIFGTDEYPNFSIVYPSWTEIEPEEWEKNYPIRKQLLFKYDDSVVNVILEPSINFIPHKHYNEKELSSSCHWRYVNSEHVVTVDECLKNGIQALIITNSQHRLLYPVNITRSNQGEVIKPHLFYEAKRPDIAALDTISKQLDRVKRDKPDQQRSAKLYSVSEVINEFPVLPDHQIDLESDLESFRVLPSQMIILNETVYDEQILPIELKVKKTVELAVFCDWKLTEKFSNGQSQISLRQYVEILINALEGIYHQEELRGYIIDFKLVHLQMLNRGEGPNTHNGDSGKYLRSFGTWQNQQNPKSDHDPRHWDNAVMLSGYDLHSNFQTGVAGIAWVGGMCLGDVSASMNEGGSFRSLYIIAHEIGHNFGMDHDGRGGSSACSDKSHIMSPSIGPGKTNWSPCSVQVIQRFLKKSTCLNDEKNTGHVEETRSELTSDIKNVLIKLPGQIFPPERQCKLAFGQEYRVANEERDMCKFLYCSDNRFMKGAHPALQGSTCGDNRICIAGSCRPESDLWHLIVLFLNVFDEVGEKELQRFRDLNTKDLQDESVDIKNLPFKSNENSGIKMQSTDSSSLHSDAKEDQRNIKNVFNELQ